MPLLWKLYRIHRPTAAAWSYGLESLGWEFRLVGLNSAPFNQKFVDMVATGKGGSPEKQIV